jgi:hypothetical protein
MTENYKYGTLIANLMREKITDQESLELDNWVGERQENMKLFEALINEYKQEWAKDWFRKSGVSTKGIKWTKNVEGWYKRDKNVWDFYIVMAVVFLFLGLVYFVLES